MGSEVEAGGRFISDTHREDGGGVIGRFLQDDLLPVFLGCQWLHITSRGFFVFDC